jgi:hypothetical protein
MILASKYILLIQYALRGVSQTFQQLSEGCLRHGDP